MRIARDALVVVVAGEELPGIIAYGLAAPGARRPTTPRSHVWPGARAIGEFRLHGDGWEVVAWEIALTDWPAGDAWRDMVASALRSHIDAGCVVAWVGAEGLPFCDPPSLFDPQCMTGSVLAWMTPEAFECPLDPNAPIAPVDDNTLLRLRERARGLADAPS